MRLLLHRYPIVFACLLLRFFCTVQPSLGQTGAAQLAGIVTDSTGAVIPQADVRIVNRDTGAVREAKTNNDGQYLAPGLLPGNYRVTAQAKGFQALVTDRVTLTVAQNAQLLIRLRAGGGVETVVADASALSINTTNGSVSTVVSSNFVQNVPLNGRSFQDLISLTPGVVTATPQTDSSNPGTNGDFSVNGQRTESNYYTLDGVSANTGTAFQGSFGPWQAGLTPPATALGTTQSLLSVDALREFRVDSSSYSAEYGRSPGGQFTFVTRSGTNKFQGSVYEYMRNGYFDANNWFNDYLGQPKQSLHQNDFGGTLGGPVWIPRLYKGADKTFFFASYEGLRVTVPTAASIQYVPDLYMRQQAPASLQSILGAFPMPTPGGVDYGSSTNPSLAQFYEGYSVPGRIDSTSVRLDHSLAPTLSIFYRLGYTPSSTSTRSLSELSSDQLNNQSHTLGVTYGISPKLLDEFRLGYSRADGTTTGRLDAFGGAEPADLASLLGITDDPSLIQPIAELYFPAIGGSLIASNHYANRSRQWNANDHVLISGGHQIIKVGIDYRRITASTIEPSALAQALYESTAQVLQNVAAALYLERFKNPAAIYSQTAIFVQDEWKMTSNLNLSAGVRWEVDPPPTSGNANKPYTVLGSLSEPSALTVSAPGASLWKTPWYNFAPRLGIAWQVPSPSRRATVLRAGAGVFFDTDNEAAFEAFTLLGYSTLKEYTQAPVPFTAAQQDFSVAVTSPYSLAVAYPRRLQLPYTMEWSAALEQAIGENQTFTLSYLGSEGRRLIQNQERSIASLNADFTTIYNYTGSVTSNYQALQAKLQRRVAAGVGALVSYTWSHAFDFGSTFNSYPLTRGDADFDVRDNLQAALTWDLPDPRSTGAMPAILGHWGLDGRLLARTGFPVTILGNELVDSASGSIYWSGVNLNPGNPLYVYKSTYPGGRAINPAAFSLPSGSDSGDAPRNLVRGFGENQINLALRRSFPAGDRLVITFRAEAFNLLNHPIFGYVNPLFTNAEFGQATQTLNQSLSTVASQYQQGGPRSMQFALRFAF